MVGDVCQRITSDTFTEIEVNLCHFLWVSMIGKESDRTMSVSQFYQSFVIMQSIKEVYIH